MEQKVRIREILPDGTALVVHVRESACSGDCHKCSGCGAAQETLLLRVDNPIGAVPGDLVTVSGQTVPVLKAAAVLYLAPLGLFFLGYLGAALLGHSGALWGGIAFLLSICLIVAYDRRMAKKQTVRYTATAFAETHLPNTKKKGDHNG